MKVVILAVGKLKESYWQEGANEYIKRLSPYVKVEMIEVPDMPFKTIDEREQVLRKESDALMKKIPDNSYVVALDQTGMKLSSENFAQKVSQWTDRGATLVFIIGGPLGLDNALQERASLRFSLSDMTFPHQMARVILLEQIYRSITILKGKKYHY